MDNMERYKPKVLFLCRDRTEYGKSYGLVNSANFIARYLEDQGIQSKVEMAADGNSVDKLVTEYNPTHVIIEALWVTPAKFKELLAIPRHQKRNWIVRLHSRPAFIVNEGIAFPWLAGYKALGLKQFAIAPNTKEFAKFLTDFGLNSVYLPNIYYPVPPDSMVVKKKFDGKTIDVGCFGAIRPMKNQITQAMAAILFAKESNLNLNFHINQRTEGGGETIVKNLTALFSNYPNAKLVEHDWYTHTDFINIIRSTDIGMQVSFTETFNIVAADYVSAGVPIVGSPQIVWLPSVFQADPNSIDDIKNKIEFVWSWMGTAMKGRSEAKLKASSKAAEKAWMEYLIRTDVANL